MKVTVERTPESEAVLNVELEWSEVEKAADLAYRRLVRKYNVPGFRRGHAPRPMLERMLGKDALYQEGLEDLVDTSVRTAVQEHHLRPLARPSVETPPFEHGQPYTFTARLPVLSPTVLGDYQSIRIEQPSVEVTEEDIQRVLNDIQQDQAMWRPAERPAQLGDKVIMDLKLTVGERTISDLHDNEFELTSERHGIFADMDAQIVGMSEGEDKAFTTTIPEDYANAELAGKEAQFAVTLKGVKYRELPALDDELAKSIGDFTTIEAVRATIQDQLLTRKQEQASRELRERAAAAAAEQATVDIHPVLVDDEVHEMMREMERVLAQNRLTLQQYLSLSHKTEEQYHQELEPDARQRVKRDLVLSAIADVEGIELSDAEIESWLTALAALGGKPLHLRQLSPSQRANVVSRLRRDKALDRLVEIATSGQGESAPMSAAPASETASETAPITAAPDAEVSARNARAAATSAGEAAAPVEAAPVEAAPVEAVPNVPAEAEAPTPQQRARNTEVPEAEA
ncbi:MAG: trigger factor [Ktedonobacterales bacterium]|nr:trigger factor [Ktedonobacterales bacterium]